MKYRYRPIPPKQKALIKLWLIMLLIFISIIALDLRMRPIIKTMAAYQAKVFSSKVINEAIIQELAEENIRYNNIVNLTYDNEGKISSLQTDMVALNRLRTNTVNAVLHSLQQLETQEINIPIGTLTGIQLLSGRGPNIPFKIVHTGYLETKLDNRFDSAGINQTRHQIMLNLNLTVTAIIPGYITTTEVVSNFCLAETVIVGIVPEAFTSVEGDSSDIPGKIFDYGADKNKYNDYAAQP